MFTVDPITEARWALEEMRQAQRDQLRLEAIEALLTKAHALATHPDFDSPEQLAPILTCLHQLTTLDLSKLPPTKDPTP
jgi:hypothetical protein